MLIAGTARNIALYWNNTKESLQCIMDSIEDGFYHIVIIESNSEDRTLPLLQEWSALDPLRRTVVSMGVLTNPCRTTRLATCRNKYMDLCEPLFGLHKEMMIVDLDNAIDVDRSNFQAQLTSCFSTTHQWDAIASNRRGRYYDVWALRSRAMGITFDCWSTINSGQGTVENCVKPFQKKIEENADWIACESAFGGMALYKTAAIRGRRYDGSRTCEHVSFHDGLRIFINPSLISGGECLEHL